MIEGGVIEMDASYKNENVKFLIQIIKYTI